MNTLLEEMIDIEIIFEESDAVYLSNKDNLSSYLATEDKKIKFYRAKTVGVVAEENYLQRVLFYGNSDDDFSTVLLSTTFGGVDTIKELAKHLQSLTNNLTVVLSFSDFLELLKKHMFLGCEFDFDIEDNFESLSVERNELEGQKLFGITASDMVAVGLNYKKGSLLRRLGVIKTESENHYGVTNIVAFDLFLEHYSSDVKSLGFTLTLEHVSSKEETRVVFLVTPLVGYAVELEDIRKNIVSLIKEKEIVSISAVLIALSKYGTPTKISVLD